MGCGFPTPQGGAVEPGSRHPPSVTRVLPGRPDAYLSSVHEADLGPAVAAALTVPSGVWNVVDDEPLTRAEHAAALARAVGRRRLRDTGRLLAALSGRRLGMVSRSLRVSNRRFRDVSGWRPSVPSAREGLTEPTDR